MPGLEQAALFGLHYKPKEFKLFNMIIFETKWQIWKTRNVFKHENLILNNDFVYSRLKQSVMDCVKFNNNQEYYLQLTEIFK